MYLRETSNKTISICLFRCRQYLKIINITTLYVICAEGLAEGWASGEGDSLVKRLENVHVCWVWLDH